MADKTVNETIVDSMSQLNTNTLAAIPSTSMSNLVMSSGQALSQAGHGTVMGHHQTNITLQATTVQGVNSLMSTGSAIIGRSIKEILEKLGS